MIRIGIDLGGTNIAVGAVNERHEIIARCSVPTGAQKSRHAGACRLTACDKGLPPQA